MRGKCDELSAFMREILAENVRLHITRSEDDFIHERSDRLRIMAVKTKRRYRIILDDLRYYQETRRRGWDTNAKAAEALGLSEATISKLLSRKIEPSASTIDCLVTELDVPYGALFRREELS